MSSSSSSSWARSASPSIRRLRRLSRLSCLVLFAAVGLSFAFRAISAEAEFAAATMVSDSIPKLVAHHQRARALAPWNHGIRGGEAYFYTAYSIYDLRYQAVRAIEEELRINPFAADLWAALAAYKLAMQDQAAAEAALKHVQALRPGTKLVKGSQ